MYPNVWLAQLSIYLSRWKKSFFLCARCQVRLDVQHPGPGESGFTHSQVPHWAQLGTGWSMVLPPQNHPEKVEHFVVKVCWTLIFNDFYFSGSTWSTHWWPVFEPYLIATPTFLIAQTDETCWNLQALDLFDLQRNLVLFLHIHCTGTLKKTCCPVHCVPLNRAISSSNIFQVRLGGAVEMARGMPCPLRRGLCIVDQPIGTGDHLETTWECPKFWWCSNLCCSWYFLILQDSGRRKRAWPSWGWV